MYSNVRDKLITLVRRPSLTILLYYSTLLYFIHSFRKKLIYRLIEKLTKRRSHSNHGEKSQFCFVIFYQMYIREICWICQLLPRHVRLKNMNLTQYRLLRVTCANCSMAIAAPPRCLSLLRNAGKNLRFFREKKLGF